MWLAVVGYVVACNGMGSGDPVAVREAEERSQVEAGAQLFRAFCRSCHGIGARGDGPVASSLNVRPPDLTRIASRRGGDFDAAEIAGYIDGRVDVDPHGRRDMPVWGRRYDYRDLLRDEPLLGVRELRSIVRYLGSIQKTTIPPSGVLLASEKRNEAERNGNAHRKRDP